MIGVEKPTEKLDLIARRIRQIGVDRVLYGSDTPFNHMKMEVDKILVYANAHLQLSVEDLRLVMGGNLKRLLGMA